MSKKQSKTKPALPKLEITIEQKIASNNWKGIPPQPLTAAEQQWIKANITNLPANPKFKYEVRKGISEIHARVFRHKLAIPCTCNPKLYIQWINDLQKLSSLH